MHEKIRAVGRTDVGKVRTLNEDFCLVDDQQNLFIVADGMGGHDAGEIASKEATHVIQKHLKEFLQMDEDDVTIQEAYIDDDDVTLVDIDNTIPFAEMEQALRNSKPKSSDDEDATIVDEPNPAINTIATAIHKANEHIHNINLQKGYNDGAGMGTTIAGLWIQQHCGFAITFSVGDSRIYRYRHEHLSQLSRDHTLYQFWEDNGKNGPPPAKNIILRAVGPWKETHPEVHIHRLLPGDVFLICSDGLTGPVDDNKIKRILSQTNSEKLEQDCQALIDQANMGGGPDNITVVLVSAEH